MATVLHYHLVETSQRRPKAALAQNLLRSLYQDLEGSAHRLLLGFGIRADNLDESLIAHNRARDEDFSLFVDCLIDFPLQGVVITALMHFNMTDDAVRIIC